MTSRTALIFGVRGQDGAYLAKQLLSRGYRVFGTSRNYDASTAPNLEALGIADQITIESVATTDFRSVLQVICRTEPTEIYNLAGQTSVFHSFAQPVETLESISIATLNLLECMRLLKRDIKLYSAGSSECFGDTGDVPATETTPMRPKSPYAVAKTCAANLVSSYRDAYSLQACTGFLFNHESPLRPPHFVTRKIVRGAHRIALGLDDKLQLGNLLIQRDWGWAPDYVEAMWMMLQEETPRDYVIATGQTVPLMRFVELTFQFFSLNASDHIETDPSFRRPSDIQVSRGNPKLAATTLGWRATHGIDYVVEQMCRAETAR